MFDLSGRVAVVTGAGQGVGAGIARAFAARGATVVVNDVRSERAETVVGEINAAGGTAVTAAFDVTDFDAVSAAMATIAGDLGPIEILVNNAGNGGAEAMATIPFRETSPQQWEGPLRVNLYGVLNCCRAVINPMVERGYGRIITISSGAGMTGLNIGVSPYGAGKGGAISFMRHLAIENARSGVTANSLAIGLMGMQGVTEVTERLARQVPVGRLGTPEDIAAICVYLASEEASWMTAQTINVNGGSVQS